MPIYDRSCNTCGELFEVHCSIANKEEPHECPFCESFDGAWRPSMPGVVSRSDRLMSHTKDRGFGEVLSKIKERNKRTEISQL